MKTLIENQRESILVIDDNATLLELIGDIFKKEGYTVHLAASGAAGLVVLQEHEVSVLLADRVMPSMDGLEFIKQARSVSSGTKCILMGGDLGVEVIARARQLGVFGCLQKPASRSAFTSTVKRALSDTLS